MAENYEKQCFAFFAFLAECTGFLLTSEVKRHRARLVLGWGTAWEDLRVLSAFTTLPKSCSKVSILDIIRNGGCGNS